MFGENWTKFKGGVAKKWRNLHFKMASTVMGGVSIGCDQHDEWNQVY